MDDASGGVIPKKMKIIFVVVSQQMLFFLAVSFLAGISLACNCVETMPVITNDFVIGNGQLCPSCVYEYGYPGNATFIDMLYSYDNPIFIEIYQNGNLTNLYNGTYCFQRFHLPMPSPVFIKMYSLVLTNALSQHEITLNFTSTTSAYTANFPQINTVFSSNLVFDWSVLYVYEFPPAQSYFINLQFNETVNVSLYSNTGDIIFNKVSNVVFGNVDNSPVKLLITNCSNNVVVNNKFIVVPNTLHQLSSAYDETIANLAIASIVCTMISLLVIVVISVIVGRRSHYNTFHQL